jgi:hypothetical protein
MAVYAVAGKEEREMAEVVLSSARSFNQWELHMWQWMSRVVLAVGFLAVVWLVAKPTVQGQTPTDGRVWMPQLVSRAAFTFAPPLRDYVGLVVHGNDYYSVRGDGSDFILQVEDAGHMINQKQWAPDGTYLFTHRTVNGVESAWITRLANQQSWQIMPGSVALSGWSPDSHKVLLMDNQYVYRYDVEADVLTSFSRGPYPSGPVTWAPDSRAFAWFTFLDNNTLRLTIIDEDGERREVFTESEVFIPWAWSPDSQRLLFNVMINNVISVYQTDREGTAPELVIEGYILRGFMDNGTKLLLSQGANLFLANADGSNLQQITTDEAGWASGPIIAPTGDKVIYSTHQGVILQNTQGQVVIVGENCYLPSIQWREDGEVFTCARGPNDTTGTVIVDATFTGGNIRTEVKNRFSPQFLPLMKNSLLLTGGYYDYSSGYPVWHYEGHYLFDFQSGTETLLEYPTSDEAPAVEWRYMP